MEHPYPGYVTGRARVIFDSFSFRDIKKGDVLVTHMTSPDMVPIFKKVSAVLTDEGGLTSHAAIVSREMKIPCVLGLGNATRVIKNGDMLEVNADTGHVIIISRTEK